MNFIDGDFPTGKGCKYHCYPTCHPTQTGPDRKYGCTHPAWPQNRARDFVPIVDCGGDTNKCEVIRARCWRYYKGGLTRRLSNAENRVEQIEREWCEARGLEGVK